jgi:hypothetical protein
MQQMVRPMIRERVGPVSGRSVQFEHRFQVSADRMKAKTLGRGRRFNVERTREESAPTRKVRGGEDRKTEGLQM